METVMLEVQKYLQKGRPADLEAEFGIGFKAYDDRIVLKYRVDSKPKYSKIVRECRGLILSTRPGHMYEVLCRGFDRFFNYGEGDDEKYVDWDNVLVFNKLDGTCINVYHDTEKWCAATNGTAFAEGETPMGKSFFVLFTEAIGTSLEYAFKNCNPNCTYTFELTSPENRIVTRYTETKATLLAVRHKGTGRFIDYDKLEPHINAMNWDCKLVDQYGFGELAGQCGDVDKEIIDFVEGRDAMDEGVVVFDRLSQVRIKIKNASYVAIHHLRGNEVTKKSLLQLCIKNEVEEYFVYFPEDRDMVEDVQTKYIDLVAKITDTYMDCYMIEDQKEFALKVKDLPYSGFLFRWRKQGTADGLFNLDNFNMIFKVYESMYNN